METIKFKTNINCNSCLNKVTPFLENLEGVCSWDVDIKDKNKVLTVEIDNISSYEVREAVANAGFMANELTED